MNPVIQDIWNPLLTADKIVFGKLKCMFLYLIHFNIILKAKTSYKYIYYKYSYRSLVDYKHRIPFIWDKTYNIFTNVLLFSNTTIKKIFAVNIPNVDVKNVKYYIGLFLIIGPEFIIRHVCGIVASVLFILLIVSKSNNAKNQSNYCQN
jgi:hypothetical protein